MPIPNSVKLPQSRPVPAAQYRKRPAMNCGAEAW